MTELYIYVKIDLAKGENMADYDDNLIIEGTTLVGINIHKPKLNVVIPDFVTSIANQAFTGCNMVNNITIPNSVTSIGDMAFRGCTSLTNIVIPDSVTSIGWGAFSDCISLRDITLPNSITSVKNFTFHMCGALKNIVIPSSVTEIGANAFDGCTSLTSIVIPDSVTSLGHSAFYNCSSLREIIIPNSITAISNLTFWGCNSLNKVVIPNSVTTIGESAFFDCTSLTEIVIPSSVTNIADEVFRSCDNLKKVRYYLPNGIYHNIAEAFNVGGNRFSPEISYAILTKTADGFILDMSADELEVTNRNQRKVNNVSLINYYIKFFDDEKKLDALDKIDPEFADLIDINNLEKIRNCHMQYDDIDYDAVFNYNIKSWNNLSKVSNLECQFMFNVSDFFKLCNNLGVLNSSPTVVKSISKSGNEKTQQIDYSQKAREFLKDRFLDGSLSIDKMHSMFDSMLPLGFKQEFADFFLNKKIFEELMVQERAESGFIARCYNEFEKVQAAHTSQRGSQRQLAPTVEFFKQYFLENKFEGVTSETEAIAKTISPYYSKQEDFDKAVQIDQERREKNIPDNILGEETIQEQTVFEKVDSLLKETKEVSIDTTSTLVDLANRRFTYEFLSKSDPINFVLGKLCSCCAHLEGAGNGIMRASIVHPDVQNIVIRDKNGVIVAKSTLYVNRAEGYGVCNNVEVNNNVSDEDAELIYKKFKKAVETFAEKYNVKYPDKPLKIITVGMNLNDLSSQITKNDRQSNELYQALNYGTYAYSGSGYNGDSKNSQYVVWENTDLTDGQTL